MHRSATSRYRLYLCGILPGNRLINLLRPSMLRSDSSQYSRIAASSFLASKCSQRFMRPVLASRCSPWLMRLALVVAYTEQKNTCLALRVRQVTTSAFTARIFDVLKRNLDRNSRKVVFRNSSSLQVHERDRHYSAAPVGNASPSSNIPSLRIFPFWGDGATSASDCRCQSTLLRRSFAISRPNTRARSGSSVQRRRFSRRAGTTMRRYRRSTDAMQGAIRGSSTETPRKRSITALRRRFSAIPCKVAKDHCVSAGVTGRTPVSAGRAKAFDAR